MRTLFPALAILVLLPLNAAQARRDGERCKSLFYKIGDRVSLIKSFAVGEITDLGGGNRVKVRWDHMKDADGSFEEISKLAHSTECFEGICVNGRVMGSSSSLFAGVVREVFEDGSAMVQWEGSSKGDERNKEDVHKLARSVKCIREISHTAVFDKAICVGDGIRRNSATDFKEGTIVELFEHRKAMITYNGFASNGPVTEDLESIVKTVSCD